jgi:DnaJ-class molecular chaperone
MESARKGNLIYVCPYCHGSGQSYEDKKKLCRTCKGSGYPVDPVEHINYMTEQLERMTS